MLSELRFIRLKDFPDFVTNVVLGKDFYLSFSPLNVKLQHVIQVASNPLI